MKTLILSIAAVLVLASCKDDTGEGVNAKKMMLDTTSLYQGNVLTDKAQTGTTADSFVDPEEMEETTTTTTTVTTTVRKRIAADGEEAPVYSRPVAKKTASAKKTRSSQARRSSTGSSTQASAPVEQASVPTEVRKRDKGWSAAAKGTAIGAGSGAVLGAVLSKNKVKGAVIGGVIGAGGGYAIGRAMDRKSGRVERNRQSQLVSY